MEKKKPKTINDYFEATQKLIKEMHCKMTDENVYLDDVIEKIDESQKELEDAFFYAEFGQIIMKAIDDRVLSSQIIEHIVCHYRGDE